MVNLSREFRSFRTDSDVDGILDDIEFGTKSKFIREAIKRYAKDGRRATPEPLSVEANGAGLGEGQIKEAPAPPHSSGGDREGAASAGGTHKSTDASESSENQETSSTNTTSTSAPQPSSLKRLIGRPPSESSPPET